LFSYLSRASNTTKYQRPENREETLTELAMFWNKRKIENLSVALSVKYKKVASDLLKSKTETNNICNKIGTPMANIDWKELIEDARASACRTNSRKLPYITSTQATIILYNDIKVTPRQTSLRIKEALDNLLLPDMSNLRLPLLSKTKEEKESLLRDHLEGFDVDSLDKEYNELIRNVICPAFEIAIEEINFERIHWSARIKKCADTSKQRMLFRKKLSSTSSKLKVLITSYKTISDNNQKVEDLMNGNFGWTQRLLSNSSLNLSDVDERALLESYLKFKRCEEEIVLIKRDMDSYLRYYSGKIKSLKRTMDNIQQQPISEDKKYRGIALGKIILLKNGLLFAECQLARGAKAFSGIISPNVDIQSDYPVLENFEVEDTPDDNVGLNEISDDEGSESLELFDINLDLVLSTGSEFTLVFGESFYYACGNGDITEWSMPLMLSQSNINGRNGSTACTVISLLIGYTMLKSAFTGDEMPECLKYFVGCMEIGNLIHGSGGLLTVPEALLVLPADINLSMTNEQNSHIIGDITLHQVVLKYLEKEKKGFLIIVAGWFDVLLANYN